MARSNLATSSITAVILLMGCSAPAGTSSSTTAPPSPAGGEAGDAGHSAGGAECGAVVEPLSFPDWVMPNPPSSGLPNPSAYLVSNSRRSVTDRVTGLVWQRELDARVFDWEAAKQYCACLLLDDLQGWQLPSRIELASLVDWTSANPAIDAQAFPDTPQENFWTASPVTIDPGLAYLVFFLNGHTTYSDVTYEYRVRCVRRAGPADGDRYALAENSVLDTRTQLTWQRHVAPNRYAWADAATYCSGLGLDGTDWRLPSINELQTLVDDAQNPSIDESAFPATPSEYFWSGSAVSDDPTRAWTAFFTNGSTYSFATSAAKNVRCVH